MRDMPATCKTRQLSYFTGCVITVVFKGDYLHLGIEPKFPRFEAATEVLLTDVGTIAARHDSKLSSFSCKRVWSDLKARYPHFDFTIINEGCAYGDFLHR